VFQNQDEFERIVMPEAPRLLRFARRLTGEMHAADDLVQETLLRAWRNFRQFQKGTSARAWCYRIMLNAFHGQGRRVRAMPAMVPLEDQVLVGATSPGIENVEISRALDALPAEHRTVLLLGIVEGFTCREVAEILSVPIGTVMSRLSRARQSLREKLSQTEKVIR
jgi:RNA polymerase sigma-70 factor (ECF subfamily)